MTVGTGDGGLAATVATMPPSGPRQRNAKAGSGCRHCNSITASPKA
ncbi:hypothetical protein [Sphingorhabdus sp.]